MSEELLVLIEFERHYKKIEKEKKQKKSILTFNLCTETFKNYEILSVSNVNRNEITFIIQPSTVFHDREPWPRDFYIISMPMSMMLCFQWLTIESTYLFIFKYIGHFENQMSTCQVFFWWRRISYSISKSNKSSDISSCLAGDHIYHICFYISTLEYKFKWSDVMRKKEGIYALINSLYLWLTIKKRCNEDR
jgi:hypothetical protein